MTILRTSITMTTLGTRITPQQLSARLPGFLVTLTVSVAVTQDTALPLGFQQPRVHRPDSSGNPEPGPGQEEGLLVTATVCPYVRVCIPVRLYFCASICLCVYVPVFLCVCVSECPYVCVCVPGFLRDFLSVPVCLYAQCPCKGKYIWSWSQI